MKQSHLLLFVLIICLIQSNQIIESHPKILWAYWETGLQSAPVMTKLCYNNMVHFTKTSNWEFRFLTKQNITNYLSQESNDIIKRILNSKYYNYTNKITNRIDVMRAFLIYENGGMWIDANSFFLQNLTWLQHLDRQTNIINRLGTYPQFFGYTYHIFSGNKSKTFDQSYNQQIQFSPALQFWSFISKKKSLFLHDVVKNIQHSLSYQRSVIDKQNSQLKYDQEIMPYFYTCNYQFTTVLQKKQKQIDQNPSKYQNIKYAVQYYKIWNVKSQYSALAIQSENHFQSTQFYDILLYQNMDYYLKTYNARKYFIKQVGFVVHETSDDFALLPYLYCSFDNYPKFPNDSIFNEYLFQHSSGIQLIQKIKRLNFDPSAKFDHKLCYQHTDIRFNSLLFKLISTSIMLAILFFIPLYLFIKYINNINHLNEDNYNKFELEERQ